MGGNVSPGALVGGIGAGVLWTSQGAFFTSCCQRVAQAEEQMTSQITAELAGGWAVWIDGWIFFWGVVWLDFFGMDLLEFLVGELLFVFFSGVLVGLEVEQSMVY